MNTRLFYETLPELYPESNPQDALFPKSRVFRKIIEEVPGMSTENQLAILNHAASINEDDEIYLEVGAYKGLSIIGAAYKNEKKKFITFENFKYFGGTRLDFDFNLNKFKLSERVKLVEGDFFSLLKATGIKEKSVGVYFYDGEHSSVNQFKALFIIEPYLRDEALIIIDDTSFNKVRRANRLYVFFSIQISPLFEFKSVQSIHDKIWGAGVSIYSFKRTQFKVLNNLLRSISFSIIIMMRIKVFITRMMRR